MQYVKKDENILQTEEVCQTHVKKSAYHLKWILNGEARHRNNADQGLHNRMMAAKYIAFVFCTEKATIFSSEYLI